MADRFANLQVVNCISQNDIEHLRHRLRQDNWLIFELDGETVKDKDSFLAKAGEQLPHEPGFGVAKNWDAMVDIIWGGLSQLGHGQVAFIWTNSHKMLDRGLPDLLVAVDCFQHLASEVATTEHGFPHLTLLRVFLVGEGDNFKTFQAAS